MFEGSNRFFVLLWMINERTRNGICCSMKEKLQICWLMLSFNLGWMVQERLWKAFPVWMRHFRTFIRSFDHCHQFRDIYWLQQMIKDIRRTLMVAWILSVCYIIEIVKNEEWGTYAQISNRNSWGKGHLQRGLCSLNLHRHIIKEYIWQEHSPESNATTKYAIFRPEIIFDKKNTYFYLWVRKANNEACKVPLHLHKEGKSFVSKETSQYGWYKWA